MTFGYTRTDTRQRAASPELQKTRGGDATVQSTEYSWGGHGSGKLNTAADSPHRSASQSFRSLLAHAIAEGSETFKPAVAQHRLRVNRLLPEQLMVNRSPAGEGVSTGSHPQRQGQPVPLKHYASQPALLLRACLTSLTSSTQFACSFRTLDHLL